MFDQGTQIWFKDTEHTCPSCGHGLKQQMPSTMVVCVNVMCDQDPMYLVPREDEEEGEARG